MNGGGLPKTIVDSYFNPMRLLMLQSRRSAAYKGIMALIMKNHSRDFISGQEMDLVLYKAAGIDIHHIFPKNYCKNLVEEQGYFILPSELFANVRKSAPTNENLNETLEKVFHNIEVSATGTASENDLAGLFEDLDVNSNKLGATVKERNAKLVKLLDGIGEMQLGHYRDNTIDAFGDAYEYLMGMYASNAGKSGGEYYTPQEVSELVLNSNIL